jgi:hypothetical protein
VINRMTAAAFEHDRDTLADVFTENIEFHVRGPLPRPGDQHGSRLRSPSRGRGLDGVGAGERERCSHVPVP